MTNRTAVLGLVILIIVMAGVLYVTRTASAPTPGGTSTELNHDKAAVRDQVTKFGAQLKNVSLLAPDAAQQMASTYAPFVAPELIQIWAASTTAAPGRLTSSPWPDRIEIDSVTLQDGKYRVLGAVVEVTSADQPGAPANQYPVYIGLENRGGTWLITHWVKEPYTED